MLGNANYYNATIRKVVVAFAKLFSDISIDQIDSSGNVVDTIKVPLSWGPKQRYIYRLAQDPNAGSMDQAQVAIVLPRMSYEITGISYDSERKLPSMGRVYQVIANDGTVLQRQYNPVPYNISFNLNIMVKNIDDGLMILEQVLPFFTPDFTVNVNNIPELELETDIPVVLNGVTPEDNWDGAFTERRMISWTLTFTAKANIYPPITQGKIIRKAVVDAYIKQRFDDLRDPTPNVGLQVDVEPDPINALPNQPWQAKDTVVDIGLKGVISKDDVDSSLGETSLQS